MIFILMSLLHHLFKCLFVSESHPVNQFIEYNFVLTLKNKLRPHFRLCKKYLFSSSASMIMFLSDHAQLPCSFFRVCGRGTRWIGYSKQNIGDSCSILCFPTFVSFISLCLLVSKCGLAIISKNASFWPMRDIKVNTYNFRPSAFLIPRIHLLLLQLANKFSGDTFLQFMLVLVSSNTPRSHPRLDRRCDPHCLLPL